MSVVVALKAQDVHVTLRAAAAGHQRVAVMVDKEGVEIAFVDDQLIAVAEAGNGHFVTALNLRVQLPRRNLEVLFGRRAYSGHIQRVKWSW